MKSLVIDLKTRQQEVVDMTPAEVASRRVMTPAEIAARDRGSSFDPVQALYEKLVAKGVLSPSDVPQDIRARS